MSVANLTLADIQQFYSESTGDMPFRRVLDEFPCTDDAECAILIESDGRTRLELHLQVTLERYLQDVSDLSSQPDSLDSAIDMSIRWLVRTGATDQQAIDKLILDHPNLETAIFECVALSDVMWSTTQMRRNVQSPLPLRGLPCEFGPYLPDGRRRFQLIELVGEGAFGQVYLAVDRNLSDRDHDARVSIKLLTDRTRSDYARSRFAEEATKARRVIHENVVRVLDRGVSDDGEDFIVYEFIEGGDLTQWVRHHGHPTPVRDAVRLIAGIARGVHAAHMAGLVHCDLKPANVMMTTTDQPKVVDFGIAARINEVNDESQSPLASPGVPGIPEGNLAFISPEQYRLESDAQTPPADIYALGGMLFWLLTGVLPNGSTPEQIERNHKQASDARVIPSPRSHRPDIDRDLNAICQRARATHPADRYDSAAAMADDLDRWLHARPINWTRPAPTRRLRLWVRRRPALAVATMVILLLTVAGATLGLITVQRKQQAALVQAHRDAIGQISRRIRELGQQGISRELLGSIWVMESFYGPAVLNRLDEEQNLWRIRSQTISDRLDELYEAGRQDHFETVIWEPALAMWLAFDGNHELAGPLIERSIENWKKRQPLDDPWLKQLNLIRTCVEADRLTVDLFTDQPDEAIQIIILPTIEGLESEYEWIDGFDAGSPLQFLLARVLARVHDRLFEIAETALHVPEIDMMHWHLADAYWMITDLQLEHAAELLETIAGQWSDRMKHDDIFARQHDLLLKMTEINRRHQLARAGQRSSRSDLLKLAESMEQAMDEFHDRGQALSYRRLALIGLEEVYGPILLNKKARQTQIRAELYSHDAVLTAVDPRSSN